MHWRRFCCHLFGLLLEVQGLGIWFWGYSIVMDHLITDTRMYIVQWAGTLAPRAPRAPRVLITMAT